MNLRYMLSFLRIIKIPGIYSIMKDLQALIRFHFIFSAYEIGLFESLIKPQSRDTLVKKLKVKRLELFDALLDLGLATKELKLKKGLFSIRGKRSKAIMGMKGDMLAAMVQGNLTYYNDAYRHSANRMRGAELGDDLEKIGDLIARFSKIAEPIIKDFISNIARSKNSLKILDVGCGSGILLKSAYDANNNATGIGLDIDEAVVKQAQVNLLSWGISDRFKIYHGDIRHLSGDIGGPFDVITLYNLLYYFDNEERVSLINDLQDLLSPMGELVIAMSFSSKGKDIGTANLNMVNTSLKGLTTLPDLNDITSLLKECGFYKIKVHKFMPGSTFYGIVTSRN